MGRPRGRCLMADPHYLSSGQSANQIREPDSQRSRSPGRECRGGQFTADARFTNISLYTLPMVAEAPSRGTRRVPAPPPARLVSAQPVTEQPVTGPPLASIGSVATPGLVVSAGSLMESEVDHKANDVQGPTGFLASTGLVASAGSMDIHQPVAGGGAVDQRWLPVQQALEPLFPGGGIRRGTAVTVSGHGSTTLAVALAAYVSQRGGWVASVGMVHLGVSALADQGVDLQRWVLVDLAPVQARNGSGDRRGGRQVVKADGRSGFQPGARLVRGRGRTQALSAGGRSAFQPGARVPADVLGAVVSGFDLVLLGPRVVIVGVTAQRLRARMRQYGASVICTVASPESNATVAALRPEIRLMIDSSEWSGVGVGHGRLLARRVEVTTSGRGAATRPRRAVLWLPSSDGLVTAAATATTHIRYDIPGQPTRHAV